MENNRSFVNAANSEWRTGNRRTDRVCQGKPYLTLKLLRMTAPLDYLYPLFTAICRIRSSLSPDPRSLIPDPFPNPNHPPSLLQRRPFQKSKRNTSLDTDAEWCE